VLGSPYDELLYQTPTYPDQREHETTGDSNQTTEDQTSSAVDPPEHPPATVAVA